MVRPPVMMGAAKTYDSTSVASNADSGTVDPRIASAPRPVASWQVASWMVAGSSSGTQNELPSAPKLPRAASSDVVSSVRWSNSPDISSAACTRRRRSSSDSGVPAGDSLDDVTRGSVASEWGRSEIGLRHRTTCHPLRAPTTR